MMNDEFIHHSSQQPHRGQNLKNKSLRPQRGRILVATNIRNNYKLFLKISKQKYHNLKLIQIKSMNLKSIYHLSNQDEFQSYKTIYQKM